MRQRGRAGRTVSRGRASARGCWALVATIGFALAGCEDPNQRRLIETYRAAAFPSSHSELTRGGLTLTASMDLGKAYEVVATRIEYVSVADDAEVPIDEDGELVRPRVQNVDVEASAADSSAKLPDASPRTGKTSTLQTRLPSRLLRSQALYYRWVVEYSSGGDRLSMRKSDIFRTDRDRAGAGEGDERIST